MWPESESESVLIISEFYWGKECKSVILKNYTVFTKFSPLFLHSFYIFFQRNPRPGKTIQEYGGNGVQNDAPQNTYMFLGVIRCKSGGNGCNGVGGRG